MSELKQGWRRVKFGEIAECVNDRVHDPSQAGVERYVGLEHIDSESLRIRRWGSPTDVESTKLRFKPGDIIFGKRRAYQRKLAVADFEGICSAHAMVLRAKPGVVLPEFLPFFMQSDLFMERAVAISVGSLSPTINWKALAAEEFVLPSLEEQRRLSERSAALAAVLNTLSEAVTTGLKVRSSMILQLYSRGTRNEALIQTEAGSFPVSWTVEALGNRFGIQLGKMMSEAARTGRGRIPYLRNANVQWNQLVLVDIATMSFTQVEREKFSLREGDILACEGRHVGKAAIWRNEVPGACYQKALHRLRAIRSDIPEFMLHYLYYFSLTGRFLALTGETTIPHLSAEKFRAMLVAFPEVDEQREIVTAVECFDEGVKNLVERGRQARKLFGELLELELYGLSSF